MSDELREIVEAEQKAIDTVLYQTGEPGPWDSEALAAWKSYRERVSKMLAVVEAADAFTRTPWPEQFEALSHAVVVYRAALDSTQTHGEACEICDNDGMHTIHHPLSECPYHRSTQTHGGEERCPTCGEQGLDVIERVGDYSGDVFEARCGDEWHNAQTHGGSNA